MYKIIKRHTIFYNCIITFHWRRWWVSRHVHETFFSTIWIIIQDHVGRIWSKNKLSKESRPTKPLTFKINISNNKNRSSLNAYRQTNAHRHYSVKYRLSRVSFPLGGQWFERSKYGGQWQATQRPYVIALQRSTQLQWEVTPHSFRNTQLHPIQRMVGYPHDDAILNSFTISLRHAVRIQKAPKISCHWNMNGLSEL